MITRRVVEAPHAAHRHNANDPPKTGQRTACADSRSSLATSIRSLLACAVTILAGGRGASACSCVVETEEDAFGRADAVFTGVLTEMEELSTTTSLRLSRNGSCSTSTLCSKVR